LKLLLLGCKDTSDPGHTSDLRHFGTIKLLRKCPHSSAPVPKCLAETSILVPNCLDLQQTFLANIEFRVPYSQQYLFNAISDTNHYANPTNLNRDSKDNPGLVQGGVCRFTSAALLIHRLGAENAKNLRELDRHVLTAFEKNKTTNV